MVDMYPDPPHLVVGLYREAPEHDTLACVCRTIEDLGGVSTNLIEVAPRERDFEYLSDLAGVKEIQRVDPARRAALLAGRDDRLRVLRSEFSHPKFGQVIAEWLPRTGAGRHPVGISLSAGPLGIPDELWSAKDRRQARVIAAWVTTFLERVALDCAVLYGGIEVEGKLPTPAELAARENGGERLTTLLFVSAELLGRAAELEGHLRQVFAGGEVLHWDNGIFLSGWRPFNSTHGGVADPDRVGRLAAAALRNVLR